MRFQKLTSQVLSLIVDTLFPPTTHQKRVRDIATSTVSFVTTKTENPRHHAIFSYKDSDVRAIVHAAKYEQNNQAGKLMATHIADKIFAICESKRIFTDKIYLVPIPASLRSDLKSNHTARLAKSICSTNSTFGLLSILQKIRRTKAQTNLNRQKRLTNLKGTFRAQSKKLKDKVIFIVDDVTTTGATFREAQRALREVGEPESLHCVAFSH